VLQQQRSLVLETEIVLQHYFLSFAEIFTWAVSREYETLGLLLLSFENLVGLMARLIDFHSVVEFSTQFLSSVMDGLRRQQEWNDFGFIIFSYSKFNASLLAGGSLSHFEANFPGLIVT
jgi:hypothetical protein